MTGVVETFPLAPIYFLSFHSSQNCFTVAGACPAYSDCWLNVKIFRMRLSSTKRRSPAARLTPQEVDTLRWAYGIGGLTLQTLAKWCGVSYATVQRVVAGKRWRPEKQAA